MFWMGGKIPQLWYLAPPGVKIPRAGGKIPRGGKLPRGQDKLLHRYKWYISPLSTFVPSFSLLGVLVPEKNVTKNFLVWKLERKKNEEIVGWISSSSSLIPIYMIHLPTIYVCTKFQSSRPHSSWWKCDEIFQCWKLERKKNEEMRWISSCSLIRVYMIDLPTVHKCTNFQSSRPHSSWEKSDEKFQCWKLERKKNEEIKGWISSSSLILVYMIHLPTVHTCTNYQPSRPHSSREKCDKKFLCWKLERKKNEEIKEPISSSSLIPVYMIHLPTDHMWTKFQSSRPHSSWENLTKNFC